MAKKFNVILCGLGAIGSIYANKFCNCKDIDFKVIVDSARLERYKEHPLTYNNNFLNIDYITPDNTTYKADLILITTKNSGLRDAIVEIKNFVGKKTIIIPLLNGVTSEETTAKTFGWEHVLYGYFIGHSAIRENNNVRHDGVGKIVFGSTNSNDSRIQNVKSIFDIANIDYEVPEDIKYALWKKFLLNVSSNTTTAIFRYTFGKMQANLKCMEFVKSIMREVISVAKAEGVKNTDNLYKEACDYLRTMAPDGKTSMLQDVEAGRKTENEIYTSIVIKLGKQHNIPTPNCEILKRLFDIIDFGK